MLLLPIIASIDTIVLTVLLPLIYFYGASILKFFLSIIISQRRKSDKTKLQTELVGYRRELSQISQVDEFAKYSKVQRKFRATNDKLSEISREDLELNVKCSIGIHVIIWTIIIISAIKILYSLYQIILEFLMNLI